MGRARFLKIVIGLMLIFLLLRMSLDSVFGEAGTILAKPWNLGAAMLGLICVIKVVTICRNGMSLKNFRITRDEAPGTYNFILWSLIIVAVLCFSLVIYQLADGLGGFLWLNEKGGVMWDEIMNWLKGQGLFQRW